MNFAPICLIVHIQEEYCAKLGGGMRHRSQKGDTNEVDEEESVEEVVTKIEQLRQVASLLLKQAQELEAMIL